MMKYLVFVLMMMLMCCMKFNKLILKNFLGNLCLILGVSMILKINFFVDLVNISFVFGVGNYSIMLIMLIFWIFGIIFLFLNEKNILLCMKFNLVLMFILILFFLSLQLLMFYFMFELSLIVMFFMIIKWGSGDKRLEAAYHMFFYTLSFSLFFLVFLFNYFNIVYLELMITMSYMGNEVEMDSCYFFFMMMTFFVKVPLYGVHSWLLKAHVEAPVFCSMILASILLKLGTYGLMQMVFIFPLMFMKINELVIAISLGGSVVLGFICLRQLDIKIIVAYSSIIHMGILISGIMTITNIGVYAGYLTMVAHGLCSSGLFYLVHIVYKNTNSRLVLINKGIMNKIPKLSFLWFLFCTSNAAAPASLNLIGEILLVMTIVNWSLMASIILGLACFLSFCFSIGLFSAMHHGKLNYFVKVKVVLMVDYMVLWLHWIPLNFIVLNLDCF